VYRLAKNVDEYMDETTLSLRLIEIFMAKKKRELSREREDGETIYSSLLDKAKSRWLTGDEVVVLLIKCSQKMPNLLTMNDTAFLPVSGTLFHFGSAVLGDGYNWLKVAGTSVLQEHRLILKAGTQPRVWVSLNVARMQDNNMYRRTYWLAENTSIGVLVHYLSETPSLASHSKTCFCLACLFMNNKDDVQVEETETLSKRSRPSGSS
jgi:hypothetical protein